MENNFNKFIQENSPDGGFLQSEEWRKFQERVGRKTYNVSRDNFYANVIEHSLPIVGKYFYVPRGPVISEKSGVTQLLNLAKKNNSGWIRIEPATEKILEAIKNNTEFKIQKAPHDMQPRKSFIIDIAKPEEQLLKEVKGKTRYNIRLAEKKEVRIIKREISNKYTNKFLKLVKITAQRNKITSHSEDYYRRMIETIPGEMLKLYVAEYKNKVIVANLVIFYGKVCTYFHGASDNEFRNIMAPYLLQWQQIKDAKFAGCERYDFGGVSAKYPGITRFKLNFSPSTKPVEFPGSYDIIISKRKYFLYKFLQKIKNIL